MNKLSGGFVVVLAGLLLLSFALSVMQNQLIKRKNAQIAALSVTPFVEGAYQAGTGNVIIRLNRDNEAVYTLPKLCPKSMEL